MRNNGERMATPDEIKTAIGLGLLKIVQRDLRKEKNEAEAL